MHGLTDEEARERGGKQDLLECLYLPRGLPSLCRPRGPTFYEIRLIRDAIVVEISILDWSS